MQEGDLVGALQKTLALIGQLRGAAMRGPLGANLVPALDEADRLLRRGVVETGYRWAVAGLPEPDLEDEEGADAEGWDLSVLPEEEGPYERNRLRRRTPRRPGAVKGGAPVRPGRRR